jgi:hypothetical protein
MAIEPNLESALSAQRSDLLNKLGNSAQASAQQQTRKATSHINEQAQNTRQAEVDKEDKKPLDPRRGRRLNISI